MEKRKEVQTMDQHLELILEIRSRDAPRFGKQLTANGGGGLSHPEFDGYLAGYSAGKFPALAPGQRHRQGAGRRDTSRACV